MAVLMILVGILCAAAGVLLWLFSSLKNEAARALEEKAVPVTEIQDINELVGSPAVKEVVEPDKSSVGVSDPHPALEAGTSAPVVTAELPPLSSLSAEPVGEITRLKEEIRSIREKAVEQARNAMDAIAQLRRDKERLSDTIDQLTQAAPSVNHESLDHLRAENAAFREQLEAGAQEVARISREWEGRCRELQEQLSQAQDAHSRLEAENASLKETTVDVPQQAPSSVQVDDREERMAVLSGEIDSLRRDNEALRASHAAQNEKMSAHSFLNAEAVESLKEDLDSFRQEKLRLEKRMEELEDVARQHEEKNNILQYELLKSRAQAAGMERVYENSRRILEGGA